MNFEFEQNRNPDINSPEDMLYLTLQVIQFRCWSGGGSGARYFWKKEVLQNLIGRFGEEVFLKVCKNLSYEQRAHFKTRDSGGYSQSFDSIYYDIHPYSKDLVVKVTELLRECQDSMCERLEEDMHYSKKKRIISIGGTGNALPLFADRRFLGCLKLANLSCYNEYIKHIVGTNFTNFLDEILFPPISKYYDGDETEIPDYLRSFVGCLTQMQDDFKRLQEEKQIADEGNALNLFF